MSYKVCQKCVMDTTDPEITFNAQGVCNYCTTYAKGENERRLTKSNRPWTIYRIKKAGQHKKYDCVIGLSGGVDSSLCLHYLIEQGIRPFAYTVDNGWNTPKSDENIMRLVEILKVPFYRYTIDLDKFRKLQIAFIKAGVKNVEIPTDHLLLATSYEMAIKHHVKYIISGGNEATESIMPESWGYQPRDLIHIKAIYKQFTGQELEGLPMISLVQYLWYRNIKRIKVVNLLDYYDYNREQAKQLLSKKYGWKDYGEKHCESEFTQWFQSYYLPIKFNIDKRRAHFSSLINSEQMTRQEALIKMEQSLIASNLDFGFDWQTTPKHEYIDYPNNKRAWDRWGALFRILRKWGIWRLSQV